MKIKRRGHMASALPFEGTEEQAKKNWETHAFGAEDRCGACDCRPWGVWAVYPCGQGDQIRTSRYDLPSGQSVWVKTMLKDGQEFFLGLYDTWETAEED